MTAERDHIRADTKEVSVSGKSSIEVLRTRYIVPFHYSDDFGQACSRTDDYRKTSGKTAGEPFWKRDIPSAGSESELFEYIRNEFCAEDEISDVKQGCRWRYNMTAGDNGKIVRLRATMGLNGIKDDYYLINIKDAGLMLCRNGIGFMWYELALPTAKKSKTLSSADELITFQNKIKELSRKGIGDKSLLLWEECGGAKNRPAYGINCRPDSDHPEYIRPFMLGNWVTEILSYLDVHFWAERKAPYTDQLKSIYDKLPDKADNESEADVEKIGDIDEWKADCSLSPDKALLFSYVLLSDTERSDRKNIVYDLTNGYTPSYLLSEESAADIKEPFANVLWYATQEGCTYAAWLDEGTQDSFFKGTILGKISTDYFTLYLKVLYQSYSLLMYANRLSDELSDIVQSHYDEDNGKTIDELYKEINFFLTKSMATSVSHTHHQSEFYIYIKKRLRIDNDVASVMSGLSTLEGIRNELEQNKELREKEAADQSEKLRDEVVQVMLGFVSILAIISAFSDWYQLHGNIEGFMSFMNRHVPYQIVNIIILIVGVLAVFIMIQSGISLIREITKRRKHKS